MVDYVENIAVNSGTYTIGGDITDNNWVYRTPAITLLNNFSIFCGNSQYIDLTGILPDADHDYECIVMVRGTTQAVNGGQSSITLQSSADVGSKSFIAQIGSVRTVTASTMEFASSCVIPVRKNSQYIWLKTSGTTTHTTTIYMYLRAYRRLNIND